jgi:intraflagellar transport protein 81
MAVAVAQDPDNAIPAAVDFLITVLNYKVPPQQQQDFYVSFQRGEKTTLYPILFWVLNRMPDNAKRVYLAQYLRPIDVPEDMRMQDDGVRDVFTQYNQLREEFKVVHRNVEKLKETNGDAVDLKKKVMGLEAEKDKLSKHMATAQAKLANIPKSEALLNACRNLRVEYEESQRLHDKYEEQRQLLQINLKKKSELTARLAEVQRDSEEKDVEAMLRRIADDLSCNRILLSQKLPQELPYVPGGLHFLTPLQSVQSPTNPQPSGGGRMGEC